jgi:hypothetical protein
VKRSETLWFLSLFFTWAAIMIGEGLTAFLLITRRAQAYVAACITMIAECASTLFTSAIAALNPDTAKSLYVASRAARGLPERAQSELDVMLSPTGIAVMAVAYLARRASRS